MIDFLLFSFFNRFRKIILIFFFSFCIPFLGISQEKSTTSVVKYTISGYVKEQSTGEFMIGANVYIKETLKGTTTNQYGFYSLTVEQGNYTLVISYIGFEDKLFPVVLDKNLRINSELLSHAIQTEEVIIEGERPDNNVQSTQMGINEIPIETIKKLPAFLGEVDILKTIQLLPGIQSAGEGNAGFYVRGGGPDQNLILLDEAVVYNASHLFGFFSVFNSDAVKNVEIIKGGMPAQYGGRLSSVLDIQMKEGNNQSYHAEGGIGLISSRLTLQGPIKKDTSSFIVSARRTYIDILTKPLISKSSRLYGSGYYFYDLNTKINYRLSDKDRIFLSGYFGRDVFSFKSSNSDFSANIPWGNATLATRWNHLFNDKLFMNTSAIYSNYTFELGLGQDKFEFKLFSGITDWNGKVDFAYFPSSRHTVKFGVNYIYHTFVPSHASAKSDDVKFDLGEKVKLFAHDGAVYISDDFELSEFFSVNAGIRYSAFSHVGPFVRYVKDINGRTKDSIVYDSGEIIKLYHHPEPRIGMKFSLGKKSSIKTSFTQNYQYIHLANLASVSLPTDTWIPSTELVKPQFGRQYALGFFRNLKDNKIETSVEVYYKQMENLIEYKDGFAPGDNVKENPDVNFVYGKGESYGTEFFFNKKYGKVTGWVGYTLSWTKRQFDDLNAGKEFYARYDRRHDVSAIASYEFNKRWTFSAIFVYGTGNAITIPVRRYVIEGNIVSEYGDRNGYRMPAYHRADISATWQGKKTKKFESSWTFAIYNVYNHKNPYFIYFDNTGDIEKGTLDVQAKQVSLFPMLPSVTWNFKF